MGSQHHALPRGNRVIQPLFTQWVEREGMTLLEAAQNDLPPLFERPLGFTPTSSELGNEDSSKHLTDAKHAAIAITTGAAVIPIVATMSVVPAAGIAGFFGMTVIAWPVVATGVVVVGGLIAFGGTKAVKIKEKAINSFAEKLRAAIKHQVIGTNASDDSLILRLQSTISTYAATRLKEVDQWEAQSRSKSRNNSLDEA